MPAVRARLARAKGRVSYAEETTSASEEESGSSRAKKGSAGSRAAKSTARKRQPDDDDDDDDDEEEGGARRPRKSNGRKPRQAAGATSKKRKVQSESSADDDDDEYEEEQGVVHDDSEDGEEDSDEYVSASSTPNGKKTPRKSSGVAYQPEVASVTKLAPAPKQPHRQGKLGKPVIEFLDHLQNPEHNDRDWFNAHHNVWKWVKADFDDFVSTLTDQLIDRVDETVPFLPPKDVVYRIHRDIRFSNDKTPYKRTLMATFSRGGRKGPFAGYHLCVRARGGTGLHAGIWDPPAPMLQSLREHIRDQTPQLKHFKEVISRPDFVEAFGKPQPQPASARGGTQKQGSLWGRDELKNGPKGFDKTHPDLDLLRLKSFCVSHSFADEETYNRGKDWPAEDPNDFLEKIVRVARVAKDFVQCLNDILHPEPLD